MARKQKNIIQRIKSEDRDDYSDDDLFSISSWGADLSFRELIDRYQEEELVKPELQRKYVWDKAEASRFIDSLLLGLPVPSIFLARTEDERMLIVDGYQRIMTVVDFVSGVFSTDRKAFRLSRSEKINPRWRGKAFTELSDAEQRRIKNTTIHCIIFVQDKPYNDNTSLYQVFERINTSGRTLLPQEIRNCIYQGSLNSLLLELNRNDEWRNLFGLQSEDVRMRDIEMILRFFALSSDRFATETKEALSLKRFLNVYMGELRNPSEEAIESMRQRFLSSVALVHESWGVHAFHNISPSNPEKFVPKFSPTIFDSIMIATDSAIAAGMSRPVDDHQVMRRRLLSDEAYRAAISQETMRTYSIRARVRAAKQYLFGIADEEH